MISVIVNRIGELKPDQTTTRLIDACLGTGRAVLLTDVYSLAVRSRTRVQAVGIVLEPGDGLTAVDICNAGRSDARQIVTADQIELVLVRTSPGRDLEKAWAHRMALQGLRLIRDLGVNVVNDPIGLERASSKLYGVCLPADLTPATLVAHTWEAVREFMDDIAKPVVIKPLLGAQGRDVFFIDNPDADNLRQLCELLGRTGYLVVQEFLPAASEGDIRILLLDGDVLTVDGARAAVRRVPRAGEFRSNVALGARAHQATLSQRQIDTARRAAKLVLDDGIRFAGLDMVGEQIVEVNVYSTGGLVDAELFYERDFGKVVIETLSKPL